MIYVFRTTVNTKKKVRELTPFLSKFLGDSVWNFDIEDCDRILRVDSKNDVSNSIPKLMQEMGLVCEELLG